MLRIPALGVDKHWVAAQIEGWQKAKDKLPAWAGLKGIIYPVRLSMEQCSSERTGRYKASLVNGNCAVDMTGGFGVDTFFLSEHFQKTIYIEQQEDLAQIASHNFSVLGRPAIEVHTGKAEDIVKNMKQVDLIYMDPARRKESQKVYKLNDCEPNAPQLLNDLFSITEQIMIKTSPMLDISQAIQELKHVKEIHVVSVDQECKEVLYVLNRSYTGEPRMVCVHDYKQALDLFSFHPSEEQQTMAPLAMPMNWLYEPNPSVLKAGAFNCLTRDFAVFKLHRSSHLYTSAEAIPHFPGRTFRVRQILTYDKKELMKHLPDGKANIQTRHFPDSVEQIRKKTGIKDGGPLFIFATTLIDGKKAMLICDKSNAENHV